MSRRYNLELPVVNITFVFEKRTTSKTFINTAASVMLIANILCKIQAQSCCPPVDSLLFYLIKLLIGRSSYCMSDVCV